MSSDAPRPPPRGTDLDALALRREVEDLLYEQGARLDAADWAGFIDLFTPDGIYWMPALPTQTDWVAEPSIFADDQALMQIRLQRLAHPRAWSQEVPWATSHCVSNVRIAQWLPDTGELVATSRFHATEVRGDAQRHYAGAYRHHLRRTAAGWRIALQRVDLLSAQLPFEYVLLAWL